LTRTQNLRKKELKNLILFVVVIFVIAASALIFAQNDSPVQLKFFGATINWPMNWVLISVFVTGLLIGVFSILGGLLAAKLKLAQANRRLSARDKEICNLRALPIKDEY
jgi:uncharacterized integral membrane protein